MIEKTVSHRIIADLLTARTGQVLNDDRLWRIETALSGIFREQGISNIDQLVCLLAMPGTNALAQSVVEALLNNETYFFRDPAMFDQISNKVLPEIASRKAGERQLSIWCAGCSTGQEALSLAMLLSEQEERWRDWTIRIRATDIAQGAIDAARRGVYSQFEVQRGLGIARMLDNFTEEPRGWAIRPEIGAMVEFEVENLLEARPNSDRFDLILCRNLLLYFDPGTRRRAFARLIEKLDTHGWLMLGAGETAQSHTDRLRAERDGMALYRLADLPSANTVSRTVARA